jgi:uncharacterized protein with GYD domain
MTQISGFFNGEMKPDGTFDRVYLAKSFAKYFSSFISNGVFAANLDELAVSPQPTGLSVTVQSGQAFINGYWYENDDAVNLSLAGSTALPRIDSIVLRLDLTARAVSLAVLQGIPAVTPTAAALTRADSIYELRLANVNIPANAVLITDIDDTRSNVNECGWVSNVLDNGGTGEGITEITSANLTIGGSGNTRTINLTAEQVSNIIKAGSALQGTDVVNNLTSTATSVPLSAAQGKALKEIIDTIVSQGSAPTDIASISLTVGGSGFNRTIELSAEQIANIAKGGTALQTDDVIDSLASTESGLPLSAAQGKALNDRINTIVSEGSEPTDITSTSLSIGGTGFTRTVNLTAAQIASLLKADSALQTDSIADNLTLTDTNLALSANQGKVLNDKVNSLSDNITDLTDDKLDKTFGVDVTINPNGFVLLWLQPNFSADAVSIAYGATQPTTGQFTPGEVALPFASVAAAGIMAKEDKQTLDDLTERMSAVEQGMALERFVDTQADLLAVDTTDMPVWTPYIVRSDETQKGATTKYYYNPTGTNPTANGFIFGFIAQEVPYTAATASILGLVLSSTVDGKGQIEGTGVISINGWDALKSRTATLETASQTALTQIANKIDKVSGAAAGNIATLDASGNIIDSGKSTANIVDTSGKADKVTGAAAGNFAGLASGGNLTDSGKKPADFATAAQGTLAASALQPASINNTLTSTATNQSLSAAQGKALNDKITALPTPQATAITSSSLTIGGSGYARTVELSSTQIANISAGGTALQPGGVVNNLTSTSTTTPLSAAQGKALNDRITTVQNAKDFTIFTTEALATADRSGNIALYPIS